MTRLLHKTAKSAARHRVVAALLGVLAVLGTSAAVYAASSPTNFTLSAQPPSQTIDSGASGSYVVAVVPSSSGFTGAVTLTAGNVPKGISTSWTVGTTTTSGSSVTVPAGSGTRTATFTVAGGQPKAGTYSITLTGTSTGSTTQSASLQLVVQNQNAANFGLSVSPSNVTPLQGQNNPATTVSITRTSFTGSVTLGPVTGLPAGASATFNSSTTLATTGSSATLTVATTPNVTPPGVYTLVVPGTGTGALSGSNNYAAFTLTVQQPGNFTISGYLSSPLRLGIGGTQPLDLSINNPYSTPLTISNIVVTLASVKQAATASGSCNQNGFNSPNFQITNLSPSYSVTVPANSTKTLSQLGAQRPTVTWLDQNWVQNGCLGATLNFTYSAAGQY